MRAICWSVHKKYLLLLDQTSLLHFRSSIDRPLNLPPYPCSNNYFSIPEENIQSIIGGWWKKTILDEVVVAYGHSSVIICRGATRSNRKWRDRKWRQSRDRKWRHRKSRGLSPYFPVFFFTYFFFSYFFPVFFSRTLFSRIFFYFFFPYFFRYYFPVLHQKSGRLKSNVLKYQWVVFLVRVVISQFMFLAEYPFKRHP